MQFTLGVPAILLAQILVIGLMMYYKDKIFIG